MYTTWEYKFFRDHLIPLFKERWQNELPKSDKKTHPRGRKYVRSMELLEALFFPMSLLHPTDLLDRRFQIGRRDTAVAISSSTYNSPLVCFHAETPYLLPPTVIAAAIIVSLAIHTAPPCIFFPHLSICPVEPQYYKSCTFSAQLPPCPFLPSQPSLAPLASDNAFLQCQRSSVLVSAPIFSGSVCLQPGRKPHFVCLSHFGSLLSHPFFFFLVYV